MHFEAFHHVASAGRFCGYGMTALIAERRAGQLSPEQCSRCLWVKVKSAPGALGNGMVGRRKPT